MSASTFSEASSRSHRSIPSHSKWCTNADRLKSRQYLLYTRSHAHLIAELFESKNKIRHRVLWSRVLLRRLTCWKACRLPCSRDTNRHRAHLNTKWQEAICCNNSIWAVLTRRRLVIDAYLECCRWPLDEANCLLTLDVADGVVYFRRFDITSIKHATTDVFSFSRVTFNQLWVRMKASLRNLRCCQVGKRTFV